MPAFQKVLSAPFIFLSCLFFEWGNFLGGKRCTLRLDWGNGEYLILNKRHNEAADTRMNGEKG